MRRERRDVKETLEIGLTIKEKPRKRQKPAQNSAFQKTENKHFLLSTATLSLII
jgi:hypothetical protein